MKTALGILGLMSALIVAQAQSLKWMGVITDEFIQHVSSIAMDVDDSGNFVVGSSTDANGNSLPWVWDVNQQTYRAVVWRQMRRGEAHAISRDGEVIVGIYEPTQGQYQSAFVWREPFSTNTSFRDLNDYASLRGVGRRAWDVITIHQGNHEVSMVVGSEIFSGTIQRPALWTINWTTNQHTAQDLLGNAYPREAHFGEARAISADGRKIVGYYNQAGSPQQSQGLYYTYDGTIRFVPPQLSQALQFHDVADQADIVCGVGIDGNIARTSALYWDLAQQRQLRGYTSFAIGVSADGRRIVGTYSTSQGFHACYWERGSAQTQLVDLNVAYQSLLQNGSILLYATAISSDGRYIVGQGYNAATERYEGFILDTRPSCQAHNGDVVQNGCVDDADLLAVLFAFGQSGPNLGRVDVNCDQWVDDADLLIVLFNFGSGC